MDYKVFVFSDEVLKGRLKFDYELFNQICLYNLVNITYFQVDKYDEKKDFIQTDENLIVFCENKNLDNLVIENINKLGSKKTFIDEQIVIFDRAGRKVVFVPLECDFNLLDKVFVKDNNKKYSEFHIFGLSKETILEKLNKLNDEIVNFNYKISYDNLLCDIVVSYDWQDSLLDDNMVKIASEFKQNAYSENKMRLPEIVVRLLKLKEKNLAICENVTQGLIAGSLLKYDDDFTAIKSVKYEKFDFTNNDVLYDKTLKFLKDAQSDVAVVTNGKYIDGIMDFTFAIADKKEVHIFKNTFKAGEKSCKQMAKNALLFHLTKKLRQND